MKAVIFNYIVKIFKRLFDRGKFYTIINYVAREINTAYFYIHKKFEISLILLLKNVPLYQTILKFISVTLII